MLAVVLWCFAAINTATTTARLRSGQMRGTDFIQFYTLARLAADGQAEHFADFPIVRRTQLQVVPGSANEVYPPVYGPQVAIALSPLGYFPYGAALAVWTALSALVYFVLLSIVIRRSVIVRRHFGLALLGAAAFPPFWFLLQHGQLSVIGLCAVIGAWSLLRNHREIAAGAMLGLLAYKPPLLAPVLAVLLAALAWRMLGAALLVAAGQILIGGFWAGPDSLRNYWSLVSQLPRTAAVLAVKPDEMHSLRTFWSLLLPDSWVALVLYGVTAAAVIAVAAQLWRRISDPSLRMATLLLAAVLAAPHLYVYDLVILAPAWIWLIDWFFLQPVPAAVGRALYLGYMAPLFGPFTRIVPVQLSVLCLAYLMFALWRDRPDAVALPSSVVRRAIY
jgi:hypothetical protein